MLALLRWLAAILLGGMLARAADPVALSGRAMGTGWSVKFVQPALPVDSDLVGREITERLEQLEQLFSTFRPQSELSRFNTTESTEWVPVAPEMAQLALAARQISDLTGGAFDVTVYPLVRLWGFGPEGRSGSLPSAREILSAREQVNWRQLETRPSPAALRKARPQITADFSSMAKGFAADAISDLLTRRGVPRHLVQVGGDIKSGSSPAEGDGWRIAIEQPLDDACAIACIVALNDQALSTSGDYRNFFHVGRQRYGHIIDPRTGQPPTHRLASVSVVHASCARSSALATSLFVLGPEEGFRLATEQKLACLFIVRDGVELVRRVTPEFKQLLK